MLFVAKGVQKQFASLQEMFCFSHSEEQLQMHEDAFRNHAPATKKMPGDDDVFRFKNFKAQWFAVFTI